MAEKLLSIIEIDGEMHTISELVIARKKTKCKGAQTQTDKAKNGNRYVQTEAVKFKNAEVQVNLESEVLNTLVDIKSKLLASQEKKDDTINKLNKKISELNEIVAKETGNRKAAEEEFQRKLAQHKTEIKTLKEKLNASNVEKKRECEKNLSLQKLLVEQINDKFNVQKNIYKTFEKKSSFMVTYLKGMKHFFSPTSIPSDVAVKQNIDIWERHLNKIQQDINQLNIFYKKVRIDMINSDQYDITWPEMPDFPRDEDNIIFVSFKPAIENIIDIEEKLLKKFKIPVQGQLPQPSQMPTPIQYSIQQPQYPIQTSPFFVGQRLIYQNLPPPIPMPQQGLTFSRERVAAEMPIHRHVSCVEQKPNLNKIARISKSTEFINKTSDKETKALPRKVDNASAQFRAVATSSRRFSENDDRNYQENEKILFQYVLENCPGATEDEVTLGMLHLLDDNKGTLSNLSKEKIVEEVKIILRMNKQSVWVAPKSPHVDWENDHSEHNCSICFEEFSMSEMYTLPCQHEFHKECIKKWLKTSSVCPICRIHSVIDDEFPPLQ